MRKLIFYLFILTLFAGCKKEETPTYSGGDYIQFIDNKEVNQTFTFVYSGAQAKRDTIFMDVQIIGPTKPYDRPIKLTQTKEYGFVYITNDFGEKIDSVLGEKPDQAISGLHFVPFDSPEAKELMVIKADSSTSRLGIIVLRHISLKEYAARIYFKLESTVDFELGDRRGVKGLIVVSDGLTCPEGWNHEYKPGDAMVGNPAKSRFWGKWSVVKHQFMIDVCSNGERWDGEFFKILNKDQAAMYEYKRFFANELIKVNAERAESELPPLMEDPNNPNSVITF